MHDACARRVKLNGADARLMVTGPFPEADLGMACYHSKAGAVEMHLNHLVGGRDEYVAVGLTAGADSFASGVFTRFDTAFLATESTWRGVGLPPVQGVRGEFGGRAPGHGHQGGGAGRPHVFAGRGRRGPVGDGGQVAMRAMEKGRSAPFGELGEENKAALVILQKCTDAMYARRDWERYTRQMVHFHLKHARGWGNGRAGANLASQVDPDFS